MKSKTKQPLVKRLTACFLLLLTVLTLFGCAGSGKWMNARATDTDPQMDFSSCRLVLSTEDAGVIRDGDTLLGSYGSIHLLSFETAEETEAAYDYYKDKVNAVEPDATVIGAEGETAEAEPIPMTEEENPMVLLDGMEASTDVQESHGVIALIDTGVAEQDGVIGRVSVLDEALEGGTHGQQMLDAIKSQDANAQVLSIRAMNDEGLGTISSLVSAMEYAIEQKVDYINLSVYAKMTLSTSVLEQEIVKATDNGILVIGAAGNDGADVAGYMPGSVEEAYIIGAAKEDGTRLNTSNYGKTVDYNVVAGSTSQAAALFTGYVSANGLASVESALNQGLIYTTDYQKPDTTDEDEPKEDTDRKPVEDAGEVYPVTFTASGEATVIFSNLDGTIVKTIHATDETVTENVPMTGVQVEIVAPMFHRLDSAKAVDTSGEKVTDITISDGCPDIVEGVRNAWFVLDKMQEMSITAEVSESNAECDVPRWDILSEQWYFEAELCGPDCLEEHVRGNKHEETQVVEVTVPVDSELYRALTGSSDDTVQAAADISGTPVAGTSYSGRAWISSEYFPGGPSHGGGVWSITFTSGLLNGNTIGGFTCYDHGKASPRVPEPGGYTATCTGVSNGNATFNILFTPDNYSSNYQRLFASTSMTYEPPIKYTDISVSKTWKDNNNEQGVRPSSIRVSLYQSTDSTVTTSDKLVSTKTLNASNNWRTTWTDLEHTNGNTRYWYAVYEVSVPQFYTVSYKQPASVEGAASATVTNTIQEAYFKLHKDSSLPDVTDDNNMYTLKGGQYTVFQSYADAQNLRNGFRTLTLDANGDAASLRLLPKTYYVRETLAPPGFNIDPTIYTINLTTGNTPNAPYRLNVEDPPFFDPTTITMTKIWNGPETATIPPLTGTQFTVKYFDQTGMTKEQAQTTTPKKTWVLEIQYDEDLDKYYADFFDDYLVKESSDDFYRNEAGDPILPLGTYTIQETKTAPGYTFDGYLKDEKGQVIATDSEIYLTEVKHVGDWTQLLGGNVYSGENTPIAGSITLKKVDSDGKSPLEGVTFRCVGQTVPDVYTATTDENGEVVFDNLYPDVYTITEISTVDGHELLPEPLVVEVPMRVTAEYIEQFDVDEDSVIFDPNGSEDGRDGDGIYYINSFTYEISNHISLEAPMTGGITGWKVFVPMAAGLGILGGLGIYLGRRRKHS